MAVNVPQRKVTPNPNGVGAQQPVPSYASNPQYKQLNQQRSQVLNEIHRRGGLTKAGGFATKLNDLNTQIRGMRKGVPGTGGGLTVDTGTQTPAPTPESTPQPTTPNPAPTDAQNALYPSMNYQLPENYQGSPLYKWQMQEGQSALNKKLAARGLLNSGAELEATNRLSQSVGAQESDRLRSDFQTEADRYERVSANEANRLRDQENNAWSRRMDLFDRLSAQSPMDQAYNGLGQYSNLDMSQGKGNAANTANNYRRVSAGGGRQVAPFVPPGASAPDYSNINLINSLFGNSNSRDNGGIFDSLIGSIGGFLK